MLLAVLLVHTEAFFKTYYKGSGDHNKEETNFENLKVIRCLEETVEYHNNAEENNFLENAFYIMAFFALVTGWLPFQLGIRFGREEVPEQLGDQRGNGLQAPLLQQDDQRNLLLLVATFYLTSLCFVVLVLGSVAACARVNIFRFLWYLKEELLLVLATSSSESALPTLLEKLEAAGCSPNIVGLVVPMGYSFNLDGTNTYMSLATLFIAQALHVPLSFWQQLNLLAVAMLTSKGAAGVSGAGFITLASTLSAMSPQLVPGMALVLGVDKFMSECRSITNIIGNAVAAVVLSAAEGELDRDQMDQAFRGRPVLLKSASREHQEPTVVEADAVVVV
eukprot:s6695_g1.t1